MRNGVTPRMTIFPVIPEPKVNKSAPYMPVDRIKPEAKPPIPPNHIKSVPI